MLAGLKGLPEYHVADIKDPPASADMWILLSTHVQCFHLSNSFCLFYSPNPFDFFHPYYLLLSPLPSLSPPFSLLRAFSLLFYFFQITSLPLLLLFSPSPSRFSCQFSIISPSVSLFDLSFCISLSGLFICLDLCISFSLYIYFVYLPDCLFLYETLCLYLSVAPSALCLSLSYLYDCVFLPASLCLYPSVYIILSVSICLYAVVSILCLSICFSVFKSLSVTFCLYLFACVSLLASLFSIFLCMYSICFSVSNYLSISHFRISMLYLYVSTLFLYFSVCISWPVFLHPSLYVSISLFVFLCSF